jgi:hypothetical protein
MRGEQTKGVAEVDIFRAFVRAAQLPYIVKTAEKRSPPEPDVLCQHETEGFVAFELVEICDPNLAQFIATVEDGGAYYMRTADPSPQIIKKKLKRKYETSHPVELLCYTAGRVVTPPSVMVPRLRPYIRSARHAFRRAWLFSRGVAHEIWSAAEV